MLLPILSHSMHASPLAVSGIALVLTGLFWKACQNEIVTVKDLTNQVTKNKAASIFE